jgi:hypothetical protein
MNQDSFDRLRRELTELPRITASPEFTQSVVARLDTPRARSRRPSLRPSVRWTVRWALAGGALVAVAMLWTVARQPAPAPRGHAAITDEALEQEYRQISAELAELRRLADETAPVLYLTSTDEFDVVLDLRPLLDADPRRPIAAADRRNGPRPARRDG